MTHYKANLRDIEFNLFEANHIQEYLATGPFAQMDRDTAGDVLREVERLALEEFSLTFADLDHEGPKLVDGQVKLPPALKGTLDPYFEGGWDRIAMPEDLGGFGAPPSLRWAVQEIFSGANASAFLYVGAPLMAYVIARVGTPEQKDTWARWCMDRRWGATMVLTEADAGSDVGAGTTKAIPVEGDVYHIEGVKRFITSGDGDYFENVLHLTLARPVGAGPGTKGLSCFIIPKYLPNADGSPGEWNGVSVTKIEDKMGIKGSVTCELTFGLDKPCIGYLLGGVHEGIRQMFHVLEDARMSIGSKSAATMSTGYLNALEYAKERLQGPDLTQTRDAKAPRVAIIKHPDVRRMLIQQKAYAEGMRALTLYSAWVLDQVMLHPEEPHWSKLSDLLLPLVKGYCSEKAYDLMGQCLQVFGGSGFTKDYPLEQYCRDLKIDSLYEGTTGIQAMDLFFRKIGRDQGATLMRLAAEIMDTAKPVGDGDAFAKERGLLGKGLEDVQGQLMAMLGYAMGAMQDPAQLYKVGLHCNNLLESLAEVVMGWLLLRHAEIAHAALPAANGKDQAFYEGKVASARWFAANILPRAALRRTLAETETGDLMALSDEAF
ncbi:MAG: acyl-CoA dehydrogenase domain protein [Actinobacteria bacterium]|nr:acyl-CoA dehydrogenase domain protein [Actinomycetota bacterium]